MDRSNIITEDQLLNTIEKILVETEFNNDQTSLNGRLLTIIKDLIVKQS